MRAKALLFDKDGTLFDFQKTWGGYIADQMAKQAGGDPVRLRLLADAIGVDLETRLVREDSIAIAGTLQETAELLLPHLPGASLETLTDCFNADAAKIDPVEAVPLVPFLRAMSDTGLRLGVATNESEVVARAQLAKLGVVSMFEYIAGYDSGHGAKPGPGMCVAFADHTGIDAADIVMVGDSRHDLLAGRAAGMQTVAVLTGVASADALAPLADAVLPDIGALPAWLKR